MFSDCLTAVGEDSLVAFLAALQAGEIVLARLTLTDVGPEFQSSDRHRALLERRDVPTAYDADHVKITHCFGGALRLYCHSPIISGMQIAQMRSSCAPDSASKLACPAADR